MVYSEKEKSSNTLLRINDLNNKVKNIDKKMSSLIESMQYLTFKLNEVHDEILNTSPPPSLSTISRSPIASPMFSRKSFSNNERRLRNSSSDEYNDYPLPAKADLTHFINDVPTYKSSKVDQGFLPSIKKKNRIISRRSLDSLSSIQSP